MTLFHLTGDPSRLLAVFGLGLLLAGCRSSGSAGRNANLEVSEPSPVQRPVVTQSAVAQRSIVRSEAEQRQRAVSTLAKSTYYACNRDLPTLLNWFADPALAPLPLVLLQPSGEAVPLVDAECCEEQVPRLYMRNNPTVGARLYLDGGGGKDADARIGDFGASKPPPQSRHGANAPLVPIIDHLSHLPSLVHQIHGIGWAYTQLDDLSQTTEHSLSTELGLAVNPALVSVLAAEFGEPQLYRSSQNDLMLQFGSGGVSYYMLIEKYHFALQEGIRIRLPGIPAESDGVMASVCFFGSNDPQGALAQKNLDGGPNPSQWSLLAQSWTSL